MTFKKYRISDAALEEYRQLKADLVDASDRMEEMLAEFDDKIANSPLAEVLSNLSIWFHRREQEMEHILDSDDFKNRSKDRDYQWVRSFKNSFDDAQTVLHESESCQLPEIDRYWSRPELEDIEDLIKRESCAEYGAPVEFEIEKRGGAPEVNEFIWGESCDYQRDLDEEDGAEVYETGGA
ncbi:hypothetical protein [Marinobacter sp.]|uniref:hypothetical protein n=1 Tax=Marinobacter sp. TaxID=50741 RepID=UPI000C98F0AD|nr:hypothetical protein [Marinobacter sp.]MAK51080.1 hypothetical protein [Marinobacter sp.]